MITIDWEWKKNSSQTNQAEFLCVRQVYFTKSCQEIGGGGGAVGVVNQPFLLFIHYIWGETVLFIIQTSCTELVGQKIAPLNHKSFLYLNHHSLVHFPPFPLFLFDSLIKGEWTTYVDLNPLLTRRVSAWAFFRGLNCVLYSRIVYVHQLRICGI